MVKAAERGEQSSRILNETQCNTLVMATGQPQRRGKCSGPRGPGRGDREDMRRASALHSCCSGGDPSAFAPSRGGRVAGVSNNSKSQF